MLLDGRPQGPGVVGLCCSTACGWCSAGCVGGSASQTPWGGWRLQFWLPPSSRLLQAGVSASVVPRVFPACLPCALG